MASRTYKQIIAHTVSPNFKNCTKIVETEFPKELKKNEVLLKNIFVGINASDINYTNGKYKPGVVPPFPTGFESIGEVIEVSGGGGAIKKNDYVVSQCFGSFAEYQVVPARYLKKIKKLDKHYLPLDLSGTTASIAIEKVLQPDPNLRQGRAVVTAAGGGTGSFAAQLLKLKYGCQVIGTCSSEEKEAFLLNEVGCDGVINHKKESANGDFIKTVSHAVHREFGKLNSSAGDAAAKGRSNTYGANYVYDGVGGDMLTAMIQALSLHGKILSIGSISSYENDWKDASNGKYGPLPLQLLSKSASLHTFLLPHFTKYIPGHFEELCSLYEAGKLKSLVDERQTFKGLEAVYDAIDYMYAGKNCGKVIVEL